MFVSNKLITVKVKDLKPNPNNPRLHPEKQKSILGAAYKQFKFLNPPIINKNKMILAGNLRYEVAKEQGIEEIQVICLEHLSDDDIKAFIIAENRIAELAGWDKEVLKIELQYLTDIGYETILTGFEIPEIDLMINETVINETSEDELPNDLEIIPRSKVGDIWKLAKHVLINGDALDYKVYQLLFKDGKADVAFVDYPYNVKIQGNVTTKKEHKEFYQASGEMSKGEFINFLKSAMSLQKEFSKDGSIHFGCMDWKHIEEIVTAGNSVFDELKNVCIWDKCSAGLGSLYRSQHEMIFVYKNGTAPHTNNIQLGSYGRYRTNICSYKGMHISNPQAKELLKLHPTVKPSSLIMDALLDCSNPNDIVMDIFAGSGSTLIAAEKIHRRARLIEIDPHYCDVIIHRFEKLTGQKAELIGNIGDNQ